MSEEKLQKAIDMFYEGASIREVARELSMAFNTALFIRKGIMIFVDSGGEPLPEKRKGGYWEHARCR